MLKVPYIEKKQNPAVFKQNNMQKYIALFLSKPEYYAKIYEIPEMEKQDYFFHQFHTFISKYVNLDIEKQFDSIAYFRSVNIEKSGSSNVCGGGGGFRSNSGKKQMLQRHKDNQENTRKMVEYLQNKYGLMFVCGRDPRFFIGHQEPWKQPSPELLKKEEWEWVVSAEYNDETFTKPLPDELDIDLVPLCIRNKTYQKWKNQKNQKNNQKNQKISSVFQFHIEEEDENENQNENEKMPKQEIIVSKELEELMNEEW